ncbi:MAG: multiheme c-type cytochrome [Pirellulaceae bacterium]|jgi:hypothetical protein|nr:multiheme c-type cytochrome [Pirellulaceae bacterium]MDP7018859.1 multiheme c-type cytochrome [Pirellulaceae bacterium]
MDVPDDLAADSPADSAADSLVIVLRNVPNKDHPGYSWVAPDPDDSQPDNCGNCHPRIHREWSGGPHARAASNRRFLNLYSGSTWSGGHAGWSLADDHPDGLSVCAPCHAPSVDFLAGEHEDLRQLDGVAARGVHCDFCHKAHEVRTNELGLTHGRHALELLRPAKRSEQVLFGPLDDADRPEDAYAPVFEESRFCASCHEGIVFGAAVYTTYSEWQESPAAKRGKSCQTCHMASDGVAETIVSGAGSLRRRPATLSSHALLKTGKRTMLRDCLQLKATREDATLLVEIVATDVGHRVPTGFIDHHLILAATAEDSAGAAMKQVRGERLGGEAGPQAGQAGFLFGRVLRDEAGAGPLPFWRAFDDPVDTRLAPEEPRRFEFEFEAPIKSFTVRLLYRSFWPPVAAEKEWPDDTIEIRTLKQQ